MISESFHNEHLFDLIKLNLAQMRKIMSRGEFSNKSFEKRKSLLQIFETDFQEF